MPTGSEQNLMGELNSNGFELTTLHSEEAFCPIAFGASISAWLFLCCYPCLGFFSFWDFGLKVDFSRLKDKLVRFARKLLSFVMSRWCWNSMFAPRYGSIFSFVRLEKLVGRLGLDTEVPTWVKVLSTLLRFFLGFLFHVTKTQGPKSSQSGTTWSFPTPWLPAASFSPTVFSACSGSFILYGHPSVLWLTRPHEKQSALIPSYYTSDWRLPILTSLMIGLSNLSWTQSLAKRPLASVAVWVSILSTGPIARSISFKNDCS